MSRLISAVLLVALLACTLAGPATAASTLERIIESGTLRVGMSGNQPPFNMKAKDGTRIGFEVDLATMIANAMEVRLEIVEKPFAELMDGLAANEFDMIMSGLTMTPRRNLRAAFVGPYIVSGKSLLTKDATITRIELASDLEEAGLTIVTLASSTSENFVTKAMPDARLVTVADYDEGVAMVLDDRADLMIADYPICALSVLRHGSSGLVTLNEPLTIEPIGVAVRPGDSLLLNFLENYLGALEGLGVLAELEMQWFEDPAWLERVN